MINEFIYNKIASIERAKRRIQEVYENNPENLKDYTKQDSIILNIQRASVCSIDLAMYIVSEKKLGLPQSSVDCFEVLEINKIIDEDLANKMKPMVGFRNIAVHDYQKVNLKIVEMIIEKHLVDFEEFIYQINKLIVK